MARLEDIVVGSNVSGLESSETVNIIATRWIGNSAMEVTYKDNKGNLSNKMLYREMEIGLEIQNKHLPWSFDVNGDVMRLVSEAYRIHLAHIFDPYLAVHTSAVEPLPHQISAVYQEMLPRQP